MLVTTTSLYLHKVKKGSRRLTAVSTYEHSIIKDRKRNMTTSDYQLRSEAYKVTIDCIHRREEPSEIRYM